MISLTSQQAKAKRLIGDQITANGRSPTFAEIAQSLNLVSKSGAKRLVDSLIDRGHARQTSASFRNIELIHQQVSTAPDGAPLYFVPLKERRL